MLNAGWPVDSQGEMGASALHWAAFNGNAEMTRAILEHHPSLELKSDEHESTPIGWAIFGSGNSWHSDTGDYVGTVKAHWRRALLFRLTQKNSSCSEAVLKALEAYLQLLGTISRKRVYPERLTGTSEPSVKTATRAPAMS